MGACGGLSSVGGLSITSLLLSEIARPCSGVGCRTAFATNTTIQCNPTLQDSSIAVVTKTLWHTLWCKQFCGDGVLQQWWGCDTCSSDELLPLFCHCFWPLTLLLILPYYSERFLSVFERFISSARTWSCAL